MSETEIDDKEYQEFFDKSGEVENESEPEPETESETDESADDPVATTDETSEGETDEVATETDDESEDAEPAEVVSKKPSESDNYKRALKEERLKRQESQRQFDELRQKNETLQKTLERIIEKANETPKPKFEDDPIGALQNELQETKKETATLKQNVEMSAKERQEAENFQKFRDDYSEQVDEFAATVPDFDNAYRHLLNSRFQEHLLAGLSKEEAKVELRMEEARIAHKAMIDGVNPGERIYQLAKLRNYQPKTEGTPAKTAAEQKAKQVENGLKATNPIHQGGGHSVGKLTPEAIAQMDDDEFSQFDWNKLAKMM